ncbi:hypothetical protein USB125703_00566 [Pseudoclavibacter triregionum]|nr:hypothetical protein USB125703_00566 [Pseudoclavibacter triregionum]
MGEGQGEDAAPRDALSEPDVARSGSSAAEATARALDSAETYGGRRRSRATLHRTGELSRRDAPLAPHVEEAVRYDPKTGQIELPGAAAGAAAPGASSASAGSRPEVSPDSAGGQPMTRREAKRRWRVDVEVDTTPREEVEALAKAVREGRAADDDGAAASAADMGAPPHPPAPPSSQADAAPTPIDPAPDAARDRDPERSPWRERRGTRIPGGAALPMPSMQTARAPMPAAPVAAAPGPTPPVPAAPAPTATMPSAPAQSEAAPASAALPAVWPPREDRAATTAATQRSTSAIAPAAGSAAPSPAPRATTLLERPPASDGALRLDTGAIPVAPASDDLAPTSSATIAEPHPARPDPYVSRRTTAGGAAQQPSASASTTTAPDASASAAATAATAAPGAPARTRPADAFRAAIASPATLVGLAALLVTALGSWRPSLWYGEAAVLSGARRGFGEMLAMLVQGPPSHALATACTWVWSRIAGESELLLRLPSAVAVGLAAAGVVVLGMKGANARAGVLAGILFAVMPRITGIGMDLEGFAWSIALAVWSTVALLWAVASTARDPIVGLDMPRRLMPPALRRSRAAAGRRLAGRWAVCLGLAVLAAYAFPTGGLVLLVHPTALVLAGARRGALREWALAAIPAALLLAPLVVGIALAGGLDFRAEFAGGPAWQQTLGVIAPGAWGWLFVFPLVVATVRGLLRIRSIIDRFGTTMLELSLAWIVLPTLALLLLHAAARLPLHPDYFAIIAPGVALFAGYGLATGPRATAVIAIVLACLCALPSYSLQRIPPGMYGADGRDAAAYVSARALPGEGLLLDGADPLTHPRQLLAAYPSAFEGLVDIGIAESAASSASLWDASVSGGVAGMRLDGIDRLWAIRPSTDPLRTDDPELETMRSAGFAVVSTAEFRTQIVYELVRTDAFGLEPDGSPPAGPELPPVPTAPPTTYPEPNTPVATVPTTIGPDGIPTAIPSPTPTVDPLAHTTPTP